MVHGVKIFLDEVSLGEILDIPIEGIRSVRNQQPSLEFVRSVLKVCGNSKDGVRKKFLKKKFQSLFEFINKVLFPCSEKYTVASVVDLFFMDVLDKFELINLFVLLIEHMHKVMHIKDGKHGLSYGYLLNSVLKYFKIEYVKRVVGTIK